MCPKRRYGFSLYYIYVSLYFAPTFFYVQMFTTTSLRLTSHPLVVFSIAFSPPLFPPLRHPIFTKQDSFSSFLSHPFPYYNLHSLVVKYLSVFLCVTPLVCLYLVPPPPHTSLFVH
jgi:hypothetical protein